MDHYCRFFNLFRNSTVGFKKIKDTFRACSPIVIESNNSLALKSMAKAPAPLCTHHQN
jgi:hypothetical protein